MNTDAIAEARAALAVCGKHTATDFGAQGACNRPPGHPGFCDPRPLLTPWRGHLRVALDALSAADQSLASERAEGDALNVLTGEQGEEIARLQRRLGEAERERDEAQVALLVATQGLDDLRASREPAELRAAKDAAEAGEEEARAEVARLTAIGPRWRVFTKRADLECGSVRLASIWLGADWYAARADADTEGHAFDGRDEAARWACSVAGLPYIPIPEEAP